MSGPVAVKRSVGHRLSVDGFPRLDKKSAKLDAVRCERHCQRLSNVVTCVTDVETVRCHGSLRRRRVAGRVHIGTGDGRRTCVIRIHNPDQYSPRSSDDEDDDEGRESNPAGGTAARLSVGAGRHSDHVVKAVRWLCSGIRLWTVTISARPIFSLTHTYVTIDYCRPSCLCSVSTFLSSYNVGLELHAS